VALIIANSLQFGFRMGVLTALGTTVGVAMQLAVIVAGMAAVIEFAADLLVSIKWVGVAYLAVLGIRTWREPAGDLTRTKPASVVFWPSFALAVANPKTLLFNAAFIPQFIVSDSSSVADVIMVAAIFLCVLFMGDVVWASFAHSAQKVVARYGRLRNRLTATCFTSAAIGLALARR
jgi:threonine/homoserine/homoserine lactone efflux protein